jgi:hypothetical protein
VGNILRRHDIPPAPKRKQVTSWKDFIRAHRAVLVATDFFAVEVLTLTGLITYYVLFFIHLESRRVCLAGVTRHPVGGRTRWFLSVPRSSPRLRPLVSGNDAYIRLSGWFISWAGQTSN